ncbi:hypothetical protein [Alkalicoccus urumqiensis]|uniref:Uncharacterized protein n=1 Tax=Alkalicoccus urumqiensis TaxID=1548213 RepID=A0A2P6ME10_ALKUR|nr:hypothetical protein [Alkalicoccus urumqiensis]PRO64504.1 hypothetical protein C6I21_14355 [Alkalicoccus urumqiensis]
MRQDVWKKAARDLVYMQGQWALWVVGIMILIYAALQLFSREPDLEAMSAAAFVFQGATIFMLVCGILSCYGFLPMLISFGLTRRHYFLATAVSALVLSALMMAGAAVLSVVFSLAFGFGTGGALAFAESASLLQVPVYVLIIYVYFLAGWLISLGFYRWRMWGGFPAIAAALLLMAAMEYVWNFNTPQPFFTFLSDMNQLPAAGLALTVTLLLAAGVTYGIRAASAAVPVKVK